MREGQAELREEQARPEKRRALPAYWALTCALTRRGFEMEWLSPFLSGGLAPKKKGGYQPKGDRPERLAARRT